jgi:MOSC domain-containing protein YiiM
MVTTAGKVLSVNIGTVRDFEYSGRPAKSAIWKSPAVGRIAARGVNLAGDDQADRKAHGGPDKAVYAYAIEDVRGWEQEIGRSLANGEFGENLTTEGIEVNNALVGERWKIGTTVLEVSEPRIPCWRLGVRMNDKRFPRRFSGALRPGAYLRIVVEGDVGTGDEIRVVGRPSIPVRRRTNSPSSRKVSNTDPNSSVVEESSEANSSCTEHRSFSRTVCRQFGKCRKFGSSFQAQRKFFNSLQMAFHCTMKIEKNADGQKRRTTPKDSHNNTHIGEE